MMVAHICEYTKTTELCIIIGWVLWYMNYISVKLLLKLYWLIYDESYTIFILRITEVNYS